MKLKEIYHQIAGGLSWTSPYHILNCVSATMLILGTPVIPTVIILSQEISFDKIKSKDVSVVAFMALLWAFWFLIVYSYYNHVIVIILLTYLANIAALLLAAGAYA